jgi:hypothetical protein
MTHDVLPQNGPATPVALEQQQPGEYVDPRWREAVGLWLRWNEAYEHVTGQMYQQGSQLNELEALMDQMDALRRRAVELSHQLLH